MSERLVVWGQIPLVPTMNGFKFIAGLSIRHGESYAENGTHRGYHNGTTHYMP